MTITGSAIWYSLPVVFVNHAGSLCALNRENAPDYAEEEHEYKRDDIDRNAVAQHRHHLHAVIELAALAHSAENTQRNRDGEREYGGEYIDKNGVAHRIGNDLDHRLFIIRTLSEVALQQAVEFPVDRWTQADPPQVADQNVVVKTQLLAELLIAFLIFLRGLETLADRFQLKPGRV